MRHFLQLLLITPLVSFGAIDVEISNGPWDDAFWVSHQNDISICNNNPSSLVLNAIRYQTPDAANWSDSKAVPSKDKTYDFIVPDYKSRLGGGQCLVLDAGFMGTPGGNDWTPYDPQSLVKTGYCGGLSQEPNSSPLTCSQAISSTQSGEYYNKNYCQIDGYGTRGGPMSGGWIDTFEGETQIQLALPNTPFSQNETYVTFEPDAMGGPMYMMALAMGQEYMHMDYQFLIGIGGGENFAGMVHWETMGDGPGARTGNLLYGTGNNGMNGVDYGPFSIEPSTIGDNVIKSYPSFFPEYPCLSIESAPGCPTGHQIAQEYMETPGTGMVRPNSPEMVGSVVISGLNFWFIYDLIANATDFCMAQTIREGKDSLAAMKMMGKAYNKGINSAFENPFSDPASKDLENITPLLGAGGGLYVEKAMKGSDPLVAASPNSEACGGNIPVYDAKIDLQTLQDFFFGTGGTPQVLGSGGVMHHFSATPEKRAEMWDEVLCTFNSLSAHWGHNPASISFRYDFLTILRVAKKHFNIERPLPNNFTYTNWLTTRTKNPVSCDGTTIDEEYPWWKIQSKIQATGLTVEVKAEDNDSIATVEWSIGDEWISWEKATWKQGTNAGNATFEINIPQSTLQELGLEKSHWMWIRTTDGCGNSTIGKTLIEGQPIPKLDSAFALDKNGDGQADSIEVFASEYQGSESSKAIKLFQFDSLSYAWPNTSTYFSRSAAQFESLSSLNGRYSLLDTALRGATGLGEAKLFIQGGPLTTPIKDKIGPVISYAAITEYPTEPDADTLIVLFSEGIQINTLQATAFLNINDVDISSISVRHIEGQLYHFVFPKGTVKENDLVNIYVNSNIFDVNNNAVHPQNIKVPVVLDQGPLPLAKDGHGFFDTNNDGTMDRLVIQFARPAQGKPMDIELTWKNDQGIIQTYDLRIEDAEFMSTYAAWNFDSTMNLATQTTYYDSTVNNWGQVKIHQEDLTQGKSTDDILYPQDEMAPITIAAFLIQGRKQSFGDQLRVDFSEPMSVENGLLQNIYNIYTQNQDVRTPEHSILFESLVRNYSMTIIVTYKGDPMTRPQIGDSLNLVFENLPITDLHGNVPSPFNPLTLIKGEQKLQFFGPDIVIRSEFENREDPIAEVIAFDPYSSDAPELDDNLPGLGFDFAFQDQDGIAREEISLQYEVFYYTNIGGFVENMQGTLNCLDLEALGVYGACDPSIIGPSRKIRIFIPWDYRSNKGQLVGSGAYIQNSKVILNHLEKIESTATKIIGVKR